MLRQSGSFAVRLLAQHRAAGSSSLLSSVTGASRATIGEIAASDSQVVASAGGVQAPVAQFSSAAAGALANKHAHITGLGGLSLANTGRSSFSSFAASAVSGSSPNAAAAAAAGTQSQQKPSILSRMAKAAAVLVGALVLGTSTASADTGEPWQWLFQDTANSTAQAMVDLHHDIMFFIISITFVVLYLLGTMATKFHYSKQLKPEKLTHHTTLEVIWTVIPTMIVAFIAVPSLTLIYSLDQHTDRPGLTVKVIGRQWYWSYEMHDHLQQKLLDPDRLVAIAEKSVLKA